MSQEIDQDRLEQERFEQEQFERDLLEREQLEREQLEREQLESEEIINRVFVESDGLDAHEFDDIETDRVSHVADSNNLDGRFKDFIEGAGEVGMNEDKTKNTNSNNSLDDDGQIPLSAYEEIDIGDDSYIDEQFSMGTGFINDDENVFNASEAYRDYNQKSMGDIGQNNMVEDPVEQLANDSVVDHGLSGTPNASSEKSSGKLISPSERNSIEERIADYKEISDVELASILDSEIGQERTDKFFSTVDKYLKENPNKSSAIPINFVLKRLDFLSGKSFGSNKATRFEGLGERALNISDDSAMSVKPTDNVADDDISKTKNESQMTKSEVDASRKANGQNADSNNGRGSFLSFNFGKSPTVQSLVGADSVMKPVDSINKNYSSEARLKYTEALNGDMKRFYDLGTAVEKNNTPKNRRELSRAISSMNQSLDKGVELLSDPSSFKDKAFLKDLFNNTRAVHKKLGDLKKAKVVGDDDISFKALMEKISSLITKTLSMVAGKLGVNLNNNKGSDNGMSM